MQCIHNLSKFLEVVNEETVQEVLLLTRMNRETLEELDEQLAKFLARIDVDSFLLDKSENDLLHLLEELKKKLKHRESTLDQFEHNLDNTEVKRADRVSAELKRLVDQLISIAHQLPDDIQRLVENEAFEVNKEVIKNRLQHSQTLADFRIKHVQLEFESVEKWEATRRKWRQLRHEQALTIYKKDIRSDLYNDPDDRQQFLERFRDEQLQRRRVISNYLKEFQAFTYADINSEGIQAIQAKLQVCNEKEVEAIQECYNGLTRLRENTDYMARERVEEIRKELHVYGALKVDPKLDVLANQVEDILLDPELSELLRLGGGLKPDLQTLVDELTCEEIVYDRVIVSMLEKLELIIGSFNLKPLMVEKGRMSQLEKVRGLVTKMRSAPRAELAAVVTSAIADFEEINTFAGLPEIFTTTVATIVKEMQEELANLEKRIAMATVAAATSSGGSLSATGSMALGKTGSVTVGGATGVVPGTGTVGTKGILAKTGATGGGSGKTVTIKQGKTALGGTGKATLGASGKSKRGMTGATLAAATAEPAILTYVDPSLIKAWYRKLAILFYGSDLPEAAQSLLLEVSKQVAEQRECNTLIDDVVTRESDQLLRRMDNRYKKLIDRIASYLENQANYLFTQTSNIGDFYLTLARYMEKHRADQKTLDNKSADEIWDISEDFRFELEDREALYEQACQKIREATKPEDINRHFEEVLQILDGIQQSYRTFHANSCFAADRYPLYLIDEFRTFIVTAGKTLFMVPDTAHPFITEYTRIFDEVERLNKPFFDKDPEHAAGVVRRSLDEELRALGVGDEYQSPHDPLEQAGRSADDESQKTQEELAAEASDKEAQAAMGIPAYYGKYRLLGALAEFWLKFAKEASFKPPVFASLTATSGAATTTAAGGAVGGDGAAAGDAAADPAATAAPTSSAADPAAGAGEEADEDGAPTVNPYAALSLYQPHPQCPFLKADSSVMPRTAEELAEMDAEDVEDYELALVKAFVTLPASPDELPPNITNNFPCYSSLEAEVQARYDAVRGQVETVQQRLREQATSEYIRQHLPCHPKDQSPWILCVEVSDAELDALYSQIRHNLVYSLEVEAFKKIAATSRDMRNKKQELTDQLEDRIRNHWPRRGRVETEIKQPREKELLSHQEKTYRMVTALQQKLIDFHLQFDTFMQETQQACDTYLQTMATLRGQLHSQYKNLAVLQGIDQKARAASLTFQQEAAERISKLRKWTSQDLEAIMANAKEFRKVCPVQVPGQPPIPGGGYSESELQEIETLILQQCREITEVNEEDWCPQIERMEAHQATCLQTLGEFTTLYQKCSQEVAMAEGLGQKYGAPRRRAQERIRSEVARDERYAGKVDEFLAQIEFIASELLVSTRQHQHEQQQQQLAEDATSLSPAVSLEEELRRMLALMTPTDAVEALQKLASLWQLLKTLREAVSKRVSFLEILGEQGAPPNAALTNELLPWYLEQRLQERFLLAAGAADGATGGDGRAVSFAADALSTSPGHGASGGSGSSGSGGFDPNNLPGMAALLPSLSLVYDDVFKNCCQETKELYSKEGLQSMLTGPNGIPESLAVWLDESKLKLLGRHGYQEKAWKRVWYQMERLDTLFGRYRKDEASAGDEAHGAVTGGVGAAATSTALVAMANGASAVPSSLPPKLSIQSACILYFMQACMTYARYEYAQAQESLAKVLQIWTVTREKHERLLRPRLGSPDKQDELSQLNEQEKQRSQEMTQHVVHYRTALIRRQVERFRVFCEDVGLIGKGLLYLLDGIFRQELVRLPPDTEIPKKHMTLKKLRKAQRIREEVARGGQDRSVRRVWPGIILDPAKIPADSGMNSATQASLPHTVEIVRQFEDLVHDLGQQPSDTTPGDAIEVAGVPVATAVEEAAAGGKKGGKDTGKDAKKAAPPAKPASAKKKGGAEADATPPTSPPSLLPDVWQDKVRTLSETEALVSSAHRLVIQERTQAIQRYTEFLQEVLQEIRESTTTLLSQEQSWNERWDRQVEMLRRGSV